MAFKQVFYALREVFPQVWILSALLASEYPFLSFHSFYRDGTKLCEAAFVWNFARSNFPVGDMRRVFEGIFLSLLPFDYGLFPSLCNLPDCSSS